MVPDIAFIITKKQSTSVTRLVEFNKTIKELNLIIKTDASSSLEAILQNLHKISNEEVCVKIIHSGLGTVTKSDVTMAKTFKAKIITFNLKFDSQTSLFAESQEVFVKNYNIIYSLIDDIFELLSNLLDPEIREEYLGEAEIREIFILSKYGKIAGCYFTKGVVKRGAGVRIIRDKEVLITTKISAIKRFKEDTKEVSTGYECGIMIDKYTDFQQGDKLEVFDVISEKRRLKQEVQ